VSDDDLESSLVQGHGADEPTCLKMTTAQSKSTMSNEVDSLEDVVLLECPYCQRKDFDSVAPLTSHIRTAHARPSDNLFTCVSCGLAFATLAKLEQHQSVDHNHNVGGGTPSSAGGTPGTAVSATGSSSLSGGGHGGGGSPSPGALTELRGGSSSALHGFASVGDLTEPRGLCHKDYLSPGALTEPRWSCRFCPVQFYDAETQRDHEETIHVNRAPSAGGGSSIAASHQPGNLLPATSVVFCSQCSLGFAHIYALADHMHHSHGYNTRARQELAAPPLHGGEKISPGASRTIRNPVRSATKDPLLRDRINAKDWLSREPVRPTAVRADSVDLSLGATSRTGTTTNSTISPCGECSASFDNEDELESHVASAHYLSLATEYGCTSCLKLFARPEELQKHLMDVHAHHLYRCTLCKHVFDSKVSHAALSSPNFITPTLRQSSRTLSPNFMICGCGFTRNFLSEKFR